MLSFKATAIIFFLAIIRLNNKIVIGEMFLTIHNKIDSKCYKVCVK